jgi:hypothetical protein
MNISVAENKHTDQAFTYDSAVTGLATLPGPVTVRYWKEVL